MSSHRITSPSRILAERITKATEALTIEQIRQALPESDRHLLDGGPGVGMIHLSRPMTSGNRGALYATLDVYPADGGPATRSDTLVLVAWIHHGGTDLEGRTLDLVLELDRITPVGD